MANIIIPHKGIDPKAKTGVLMGTAEIILKDADTGKVKEVVKQKNMFTNALDSLFNKSCFNIANPIINTTSNNFPAQTPINEKALGGILLFPNALGNDADLLYPDFALNYPTGYASRASYTQDDSKQGVFDGVSSGEITNGYRFVYTWGSAFGNGQIASVALSNVNCYKYFTDVSTYRIGNIFKQFFYNWSYRSIGYNNQGLVFSTHSNTLHLGKFTGRRIDLMHNYNGTPPYEDFVIPDFTFNYGHGGTLVCVTNDYIHAFDITSSTSFKYTKIDCSDWTNTVTTYTNVDASLRGAEEYYNACAVRGNYVYLPKDGWGSLYKINLTNITDITEITMPSGLSARYMQTVCGSNIYGFNYIIGTDDVVRTISSATSVDNYSMPAYQDGVWVASIPISSGTHGIRGEVLASYCATHANLVTPVTKTADNQMVVNYTVLQV